VGYITKENCIKGIVKAS